MTIDNSGPQSLDLLLESSQRKFLSLSQFRSLCLGVSGLLLVPTDMFLSFHPALLMCALAVILVHVETAPLQIKSDLKSIWKTTYIPETVIVCGPNSLMQTSDNHGPVSSTLSISKLTKNSNHQKMDLAPTGTVTEIIEVTNTISRMFSLVSTVSGNCLANNQNLFVPSSNTYFTTIKPSLCSVYMIDKQPSHSCSELASTNGIYTDKPLLPQVYHAPAMPAPPLTLTIVSSHAKPAPSSSKTTSTSIFSAYNSFILNSVFPLGSHYSSAIAKPLPTAPNSCATIFYLIPIVYGPVSKYRPIISPAVSADNIIAKANAFLYVPTSSYVVYENDTK